MIPKSTPEQMKLAQEEESHRLAEYRVRFGMRVDAIMETRALEDHYRECRHIIRCFHGLLKEDEDSVEVDVDHWEMDGCI